MVYSEAAGMEEPTRPHATVELVYKYRLVNTPDQTILALKVTFPPNASTPPHTHAGASVVAHVLKGTLLNKMNDEPMTIKRAGDSFYEAPGCRHRISDNASTTEEAILIAQIVHKTDILEDILAREGIKGLVVIDEEYR